jgi:hypothetical protein
MNRRGVDFTLVQAEPDLWKWRFKIGKTVTTGKTQTTLKGLAAHRVRQRIDRALNRPRELAQAQPDGGAASYNESRETGSAG